MFKLHQPVVLLGSGPKGLYFVAHGTIVALGLLYHRVQLEENDHMARPAESTSRSKLCLLPDTALCRELLQAEADAHNARLQAEAAITIHRRQLEREFAASVQPDHRDFDLRAPGL
jgi:hypothetical protein